MAMGCGCPMIECTAGARQSHPTGEAILRVHRRIADRGPNRLVHPADAVWPVDAFSLAVACGGRGVSLDIWPASHSAPAAPRAVRLSGHDRDRSPSRTTRRATTWFPPRRVLPGRRGLSAPRRPPWPSVVRFPPARYHEVGVPVPMRCVDRLCCCVAARHWRSFSLPLSHAGLFVPATSPVATGVCGAPCHRRTSPGAAQRRGAGEGMDTPPPGRPSDAPTRRSGRAASPRARCLRRRRTPGASRRGSARSRCRPTRPQGSDASRGASRAPCPTARARHWASR